MNIVSEANEIVRRKWRDTGKPWKVLLFVLICLGACVGLVYFGIWVLGKFVKGLGGIGVRNKEFYFPKGRR